MLKTIRIDSRYKGPPTSGNGGYVCGLLGQAMMDAGYKGAVEASLKAPPPLETALTLTASPQEARLSLDDRLLGVATAVTLDLQVPAVPAPGDILPGPLNALEREGAFRPFGTCFVCGADRKPGDGLCIACHEVKDRPDVVATTWTPDASLARPGALTVDPVFLWSALDCPGYFACACGEPALLGRLTAEITGSLKVGEPVTVIGWNLGGEGRKRQCGTALVRADGTIVAKALGLWVIVDAALIAGAAA
ncbi:hypothetical protein [Gimibacter soli]|uniref:Uncharacterized protein n=1 Tax=Gimibacter soli TaxID=3024400 RepID=A0AAE9XTN8_9PROT|nr:hypothetical protein [Gimibacter soli]WCL54651.1 hypothetical protein PH603_02615 [Gimibacter soli]